MKSLKHIVGYALLSVLLWITTDALMNYIVFNVVGRDNVDRMFVSDLQWLATFHIISPSTAQSIADYWLTGEGYPSLFMRFIAKLLRVAALLQASGSVEGAGKWIGLATVLIITAFVLFIRTAVLVSPLKKMFHKTQKSNIDAILATLESDVEERNAKREDRRYR